MTDVKIPNITLKKIELFLFILIIMTADNVVIKANK